MISPHAEVAVHHRRGALHIEAAFEVTAPWTVLFGPSGSGKSTLLRHIAGLTRPETGRIAILGQLVSTPGLFVAPHRRPIRWAGQRAALFPGKTIRQNIAMGFGPASQNKSVDEAIDHFDLRSIAGRYPSELSGGQRQCVSVVRAALGAQNKLLLLDEPFTGLDAGMRDALIAALRQWLGARTPILSVTHDIGEAYLLQAEIIRLAHGRVIAQGPANVILAEERRRLLATLS